MPSTRFVTRAALMACAAMALSACAADQTGPQSESSSAARSASPYPSTYAPYPGRPTALVGPTLFDGRGGQMQNATVLFENGRSTAVGDASLEVIGGLPELESLNLYGTSVTDEGLRKLSGLQKLRKLYLWQTKVTDKGVEELRKALPECEVVTGV